MRLMLLWSLPAIWLVPSVGAQERAMPLPEILIGGEGYVQAASDRCVEVEIGSSRAMDCLNQRLKREVDRVNPSLTLPPLDARSPDTKVGVVNVPAVQQQYGKNFGVSVMPYRPPPLTFTSPLGSRH
ncbi:MAG TPA: hypothetical protein VGC77_14365 [Rhodopseudomonas sp.]|uniref:hypothetical protein n=1 Tax=Rhodopseudomonas sp. TaxID=1078 RepID=UPI002ED9858D